jgi:hypothetical protein
MEVPVEEEQSCVHCAHFRKDSRDPQALAYRLLHMLYYPEVKFDCLLHHLPFIKGLNPSNAFSDEQISQLTHLQELVFYNEQKISGEGIQGLTNLVHLSLGSKTEFADKHFAPLTKLASFAISSVSPSLTGATLSPTLTQLELRLNQYLIMKPNLPQLANLTSLSLKLASSLQDDQVASFAATFPKLTALRVNGQKMTGFTGKTLSSNLTELSVSSSGSQVTIGHLTNLTDLTLTGCVLDNVNFQPFHKLKRLTLEQMEQQLLLPENLLELNCYYGVGLLIDCLKPLNSLIKGTYKCMSQPPEVLKKCEFDEIIKENRKNFVDPIVQRALLLMPFYK